MRVLVSTRNRDESNSCQYLRGSFRLIFVVAERSDPTKIALTALTALTHWEMQTHHAPSRIKRMRTPHVRIALRPQWE
jgi:hypothetical protein